jgi:ornithine cyclodeaminase/alanine dehydrogenase-like protein (mu-crystallin family)
MPLLLAEPDVARCLAMRDLIPLMRDTLAAFSRGECIQPVRANLAIKDYQGFYGVMPAYVPGAGGGALGIKSVTFYPENRPPLHTHLATILLLDARTGGLAAIMDGRLITEMRTAAVSAVSVDLLARKDATRLAILGSGVQARSHLEAMSLVRPLSEVRVWSRTREHAEKFGRDMSSKSPCAIEVKPSAREAVEGAEIVVTATSATEPITEARWFSPGSHLCVVGSSNPRVREVDTETVARSRVFVDSRAGAAREAGDLVIPVAEGRWSLDRIGGELGEVANGAPGRRSDDEITLFKSLGMAVEDVATARLVLAGAERSGVGRKINL